MTVAKEKLSDYKEQYEKAETLVEEDSKHDPETEPFRSHYAARNVLLKLANNLKNELEKCTTDAMAESGADSDTIAEHIRTFTFILGFVLKDAGRICIWTEELSTGEIYLQQCLDCLEAVRLDAGCINAYLGALNQIGILWSNRENAKKSHEYLQLAADLYGQFKESGQLALTIYDVFGTKDEIVAGKGMDVLEKTHTLTLYYLAQIVGSLGDLHKSAVYCHTTLRRQLEFDDFEPIDWALNAATLSQYFFANNRMTESRHHLAAANYMLDRHEQQMYTDGMSDEQKAAVREVFHHRSADVLRCWAKYGLNLLLESKNRLLEDDDDTPSPRKAKPPAPICRFESIDLTAQEAVITDQYLLMFDDAKPVFLVTQQWLHRAKEYYTAESEASEYAKIVQDLASSYKYLAFYDFDESNECKLYKRSADLLEDLLLQLNETYYMAICRELWYELGMAYSSILEIKLVACERTSKSGQTPSPHVLNKINMLCQKGIARYQRFVDSYREGGDATKPLPPTLSTDELEPILFAIFHVARLYYKIMTPDRALQIANTENSLKYYQQFVKGCEANEEAGAKMKAEYGVCKEMITLLPLKIKKLADGSITPSVG